MIIYEDRSSPTSVTITLQEAGDDGLSLAGHDVGHAPKECFGAADYEYVLTIPRAGIRPLLLALLQEKYAGDPRAVSRLRGFCERKSIPHSFWCS